MRKIITLSVLSLFCLTGCAWFQAKEEKTAIELANEGMALFEDGKYRKAIESFEKLKDWYPFSRYASLAELKMADSYFALGEYQEAIYMYEEFETLHPRNEAVPYVIYQIGRSYFSRMESVDRDQTPVRKALDTFQRLIRQYPDSEYAAKARNHVKMCQKNLAGHEFYVGMFYFNNKRYKPALSRFESLLVNYPDVGNYHQKALDYIALCRQSLDENEEDEEKVEYEPSIIE